MKNGKGSDRSYHGIIDVLTRQLRGGTEENNKELLPRLEPNTSQIIVKLITVA
jgi:hypothetical protein